MATNFERISGYNLFTVPAERVRIGFLLSFLIERLSIREVPRWVIPHSIKDPEGKITRVGFFVVFQTLIAEFRNFLNEINFNTVKIEPIRNLHLAITDYNAGNNEFGEGSSLSLKVTHSEMTSFSSFLTVYGKAQCDFVISIAKELQRLMK